MDRREMEAAAERIQRGALRKMALFGAAFLIWQILYFTIFPDPDQGVRTVDIVRTAALLVWSLALLLLFATGGGAFRGRQLRRFLDDERARALRATAYRNGFWTMVAICILAYVATMLTTIRAADLAHICLSAGILSVLLSQVVLERR
jgi:hypothetical protein